MPVKLVQLKIKASAVHAGHSLLLLLLSPPSLLIMAPHPVTTPNSNLFPAHLLLETLVAVVAGTSGLGTTLRSMLKKTVLTTLIPQVLLV